VLLDGAFHPQWIHHFLLVTFRLPDVFQNNKIILYKELKVNAFNKNLITLATTVKNGITTLPMKTILNCYLVPIFIHICLIGCAFELENAIHYHYH
jgi:hypothetical protein